jgi:glycerophosphoryl diester phosphodiesterase
MKMKVPPVGAYRRSDRARRKMRHLMMSNLHFHRSSSTLAILVRGHEVTAGEAFGGEALRSVDRTQTKKQQQASKLATTKQQARKMVKFGGHLEAFIEGDNRGTELYVVPYNTIKGLIFAQQQDDSASSSCTEFLNAWNAALSLAEDDFRLARKELWERIFQTVAAKCAPLLRGAHPGNALKAYVENSQPDQAQDTLARMNKLHAAASINTEALRKLVKKFDKYRDESQSLSLTLLPALYTSSLYSSQNMLQDGIALARGLLDKDDSFNVATSPLMMQMIRRDSEARHQQAVAVRMEELDWLKRLVASISATDDDLLPKLVAHRGFHHIRDRNDKRPLENSLSAYEMAWTSGIHLCECDIAMTRDEKLVLAHDENFLRLALDDKDPNSYQNIGQLTFRQLINMPLKSGVRPPLLVDVLRSAHAISEHSKLVIEVKPGNEAAASALARLLIRHVDLRQAVAMIMSFDANTMHRLRSELSIITAVDDNTPMSSNSIGTGGMHHHRVTSFDHFGTMTSLRGSHHRLSSLADLGLSLSQTNLNVDTSNNVESLASTPPKYIPAAARRHRESISSSTSPPVSKTSYLPKLMLLTVSDTPHKLCEQRVNIDDLSLVENWLRAEDGSLDGVYLQFEHQMMTAEGAKRLRKLSERFHIGVWTRSGKDPDDYATFEWLTRQCNCTFVNTDLPNHFRKDVIVRNSSNGIDNSTRCS